MLFTFKDGNFEFSCLDEQSIVNKVLRIHKEKFANAVPIYNNFNITNTYELQICLLRDNLLWYFTHLQFLKHMKQGNIYIRFLMGQKFHDLTRTDA